MTTPINTVNYFEIGTPDAPAARAFYGELFGWDFGTASPTGYRMVNENEGGLWETAGTDAGAWAIFYVEVADIAATVEAALANGADSVVPIVDNGAILFAHLSDPAGNRFGVWQRKPIG